eukprot:6208028-Pleurochrysis_carterae.AAC.1
MCSSYHTDEYASLYNHLTGNDPGSSLGNPHVGTAPTGTSSQATNLSEVKDVESEHAYYLRSRKLFGLIRLHVTDPAIHQELETTVRGNGKPAWQVVETHGQPLRTGLTIIDENNACASLRFSDVGVEERTIIKIVAKINQINFERASTRQFSESERRLKFFSMMTYPAHRTTKAQEI